MAAIYILFIRSTSVKLLREDERTAQSPGPEEIKRTGLRGIADVSVSYSSQTTVTQRWATGTTAQPKMPNWSAIDPKSTRGRLVRLPAKLLPKSTVMHIRHGPARGMKWISGSAVHGCWLGTYELEKQKLLERIVRPGMTVYDIGAQAGFYTLLCSRLVGDAGRVIAFEPSISEARYLLEHVRINQLANVSIVQAAVGASPSLSGFSSDRAICQNRLTAGKDKPLCRSSAWIH